MPELKHLFQPLTIRHDYKARAEAGVGLITMEPSYVSPRYMTESIHEGYMAGYGIS
jgi:hypothetical protein